MKKTSLLLMFALCSAFIAGAQTFTLKSKDIGGQITDQQVYNSFGCTGENISPELYWENPPAGTKSFAVTVYDPDAPTGSGWWHWLIFNIPDNIKELNQNAGNPTLNLAPAGSVQSVTSFGAPGYGGPCPPEGDNFHRYIFTVFALKVDKLNLDQNTNPEMVGYNLNANTIEKASLVSYFKR